MVGNSEINESYRFLIEQISDGVVVADQDGTVCFVNPAAAALLDRDHFELIGQPLGLPIVDADFAKVNLVRRDGKPVYAELRSTQAEWEGRLVYVLVLRDVTLRHEAEAERAQHQRLLAEKERQVLHAQKMDSVGRLAGGIAHDFNNMLSIIVSYASLITSVAEGEARQHAEQIVQTSERAARLARQLLVFSRNQILRPRVWSVNQIVQESAEMFRRLLPENIEMAVQLVPDAGNVKADRVQIEQVMINVLVNARDAMPGGGTLKIETGRANGPTSTAIPADYSSYGAFARLRISDSGCGMTPEVQARAFEPFYTTKDPGCGTGLGLSTVYGIVTQSGGHIHLESAPGEGTTVDILLPLTDEQPEEQATTPQRKRAPERKQQTILVVEDEKLLRLVISQILKQNGYNVVTARNGKDALQILERQNVDFHALITDLVMPEMGGIELAEELLRERPSLPVIYVSGYSDHTVERGPLVECVEKPFQPETLLKALRGVLACATMRSGAGAD